MSVRREQIAVGLRVHYHDPVNPDRQPKVGTVVKVGSLYFNVDFDDGTIRYGNPLTFSILRCYDLVDPVDTLLDAVLGHE